MEKIESLTSEDIVQKNVEKLKKLFPAAFSEGRLITEDLLALLEDYTEKEKEYYHMDWAGKTRARMEANKVSTGTLRPAPEESKHWDDTGNLFIEGDNLEVLKLLQKSYSNKVKMIYIDPPYNTGKDFVYKDNYHDNLQNYLELSGQTDESGKKLSANTESDGRYHSNWLNMMYPRLMLARNLLTEDGVIFISIDDNEQANLKKLCDEIFGEENFIANVIWEQGRKSAGSVITTNHEYILVYSKSKNKNIELNIKLNIFWKEKKKGLDQIYEIEAKLRRKYESDYMKINSEIKKFYSSLEPSDPTYAHKHYNFIDERGIYFAADASAPDKPETRCHKPLLHPITKKATTTPRLGWRFSEATLDDLVKANRIHFGVDEKTVPCVKRYLKETEYTIASSVFYKDGRGATNRLKSLFGRKVFDFPKDEQIISRLINYIVPHEEESSAVIFDFFAGSGTTAHAVMALNAEDGGNRKCISVQLPEPTEEKSEAYKAGYPTIAEIAKERIRRAGAMIQKEEEEKIKEKKEKLEKMIGMALIENKDDKDFSTHGDKLKLTKRGGGGYFGSCLRAA